MVEQCGSAKETKGGYQDVDQANEIIGEGHSDFTFERGLSSRALEECTNQRLHQRAFTPRPFWITKEVFEH